MSLDDEQMTILSLAEGTSSKTRPGRVPNSDFARPRLAFDDECALVCLFAEKNKRLSIVGDLDHCLAEVLALEDAEDRFGSLLQAFGHVFFDLQFPVGDPLRHLRVEVLEERRILELIGDDEALQFQAFADDVHQISNTVGVLFVVLRDHSALDEPSEGSRGVESGFQLIPADVVEVDVQRIEFRQFSFGVGRLVVESVIEVQLILQPFHLLVRTRRANHFQTFALR